MKELITNDTELINSKMKAIYDFQKIVKAQLIENEDFGRIPGVAKPFLYKSGAEKILSIIGVNYEKPEYIETWSEVEIEGIRIPYYEVVCKVTATFAGEIVGFGVGSCNTLMKKYCKTREGELITDPIHYYSIKNTILKMAEKCARVDLALQVGALSNIFTQDEDSVDIEKKQVEERKPSKKQIDYMLNLLNKVKEDKDLMEKIITLAKITINKETGEIIVQGNSEEVSKAIDILLKNENNNQKA